MRFNRFYSGIFLRIISIVLFCFLFVYFVERDDNILTVVFIIFLVLIQVAFLIKYVNRTNRELAEFLIHLQQGDTSVVFSKENIENTFKGLRSSFEKINLDLQQIRSEKEQQEHYLNYVIQNIKTGLLAFSETGAVEFVNRQAKIFLNKEHSSLVTINKLDDEFLNILKETKASESIIIKKIINDELCYLAFSSSEFKIDTKKVKLFTIHDVKHEIESNEIESWQKLTSVLTHEMMNSITPITSLAHAIKRYLKSENETLNSTEISDELISDIVENADIIENRGKGLLEFIDNYRSITKVPIPKFETIQISALFQNIIPLFEHEINQQEIALTVHVQPDNLSMTADKSMIEQVIINLLKNSMEAFSDTSNPQISIHVSIAKNQKLKIELIDNGKGIDQEMIDDVFIPFYTTKKDGSGIGLPLSRQIMKLHKGSVYISSEPHIYTKVTLIF